MYGRRLYSLLLSIFLFGDFMKKTVKLALSSVIASLSVVIMLLTGLIPIGTYAAPCFVGMFLALIVLEAGYSYAVSVYIVVSALSFLLSSDKEACLYYTAFFGIYPILKGLMEKLSKVWLQYILKFAAFNVSMILAFFVSIYVLMIPKESFELFGIYLPWAFLLAGNLIFIVYDFAFTRIISTYALKWRKKLRFK